MNAELIKFEVKEIPELCVVGKEIIVEMAGMEQFNPIPGFWQKCLDEKLFEKIGSELKDFVYDPAYAGFMKIINEKEFTNVCGILMKPGVVVPPGYVSYRINSFTAAIGWVKGKEPVIYMEEHTLTEKAAGEAGYTHDGARGFSIELYNHPRFTVPDESGNRILDYYMPVKKV